MTARLNILSRNSQQHYNEHGKCMIVLSVHSSISTCAAACVLYHMCPSVLRHAWWRVSSARCFHSLSDLYVCVFRSPCCCYNDHPSRISHISTQDIHITAHISRPCFTGTIFFHFTRTKNAPLFACLRISVCRYSIYSIVVFWYNRLVVIS